ncbi:MAG: hypothetical protein Unbinned2514contig1001_18 [Prokaryotic dsDNA virus sp.]|nr:MAG: hypothetical protein Unbinned2514contig1001_18 [Prokaryotic dsDNA virus sp.]
MKYVELNKKKLDVKVGQRCKNIEPNIIDDTIFIEENKIVGFYIKKLPKKIEKFLQVIDNEFRSKRVPKQNMSRGPQGKKTDRIKNAKEGKIIVEQYSTTLGSMLPKPHMRRNYCSFSSVHHHKSAKNYIKAMYLLGKYSEQIMKDNCPDLYETHKRAIEAKVPERWRFSNIFTSSISNYNISAPYHIDRANLKNCINMIYTTRQESDGGCLHIPEYDAVIEMAHNSLCVYPAWRNIHGVTPIKNYNIDSYRNTHIFYALKGFEKYGAS